MIQHERSRIPSRGAVSRRSFLRGATASLLATGAAARVAAAASSYPFTLGVASGDPTPDSVVLWTRLAPDPLNGGGMGRQAVEVQWEVADDENLTRVVQGGTTTASPEWGHSVHVRVRDLDPDRWYWYRFTTASHTSAVGRTRTVPLRAAEASLLRFAFASCQNWEQGFYAAWKHIAAEDLDFVVHLGDYIYEFGASESAVRQHVPTSEIMTLADYRNRHAQYRTDPHLQAAHARFPFIVTWDDHEVENNYANAISANNGDADLGNDVRAASFLARRARAYRAYFEHMPIAPRRAPDGAALQLFRRLKWGRLAQFDVLDTRQYRSDQPCARRADVLPPIGDDMVRPCGAELDPAATLLGAAQEEWLLAGLHDSRARWNVIAQQVMMAAFDFGAGLESFDPRLAGLVIRNADAWDGYVAARNRLLSFIRDRAVRNLVVITGDIHSSWVADLKADYVDPASPTVGTEFVGTSITSPFPLVLTPIVQAALPANPHVKFFEGASRGYVRCTVTPAQWRSDFRAVTPVSDPDAPVETIASFVVEDGAPGAQPVS